MLASLATVYRRKWIVYNLPQHRWLEQSSAEIGIRPRLVCKSNSWGSNVTTFPLVDKPQSSQFLRSATELSTNAYWTSTSSLTEFRDPLLWSNCPVFFLRFLPFRTVWTPLICVFCLATLEILATSLREQSSLLVNSSFHNKKLRIPFLGSPIPHNPFSDSFLSV